MRDIWSACLPSRVSTVDCSQIGVSEHDPIQDEWCRSSKQSRPPCAVRQPRKRASASLAAEDHHDPLSGPGPSAMPSHTWWVPKACVATWAVSSSVTRHWRVATWIAVREVRVIR
jgi:hypothetical protein